MSSVSYRDRIIGAANSFKPGRIGRRPKRSLRWLHLDILETRITPANLTPIQVQSAYGVNQIAFGTTTGDGAGQTIAILDPGDDPSFVDSTNPNFSNSDLGKFDTQYNLATPNFRVIGNNPSLNGGPRPNLPFINIASATESGTTVTITTTSPSGVAAGNHVLITGVGVGGYNGYYSVTSTPSTTSFTYTVSQSGLADSSGGSMSVNNSVSTIETALDVEWAHAIAPQANIVLIEMFNLTGPDVVNAVQTANKIGASVVSMSFSFSEFNGEQNLDPNAFDTGLFTGAGVSYVASSGDNGAFNSPPAPAGFDTISGFPASSPNVLSVGATNLTVNTNDNSWGGETAWSNPTPPAQLGNNRGGSGGGFSQYETKPAFQGGLVTNVPGTQRAVPDVAFVGGGQSPVSVYDSFSGGFLGVVGTSVSAPCWAGLIAIADEGFALRGQPPIDTHSTLQTSLYNTSLSDFHDITSGFNGYNASPGYDLLTGIGSPLANLLIPDLAGTSIDYVVPNTGGAHSLVLRSDGTNADLFDNGFLVGSAPLTVFSDVNITDGNNTDDSLLVDDATGGTFKAQIFFNNTGAGYDTVALNAPNGRGNVIFVSENPNIQNAGSIDLNPSDPTGQTIHFQSIAEVDVNAGSGSDGVLLQGHGGSAGLQNVHINGGSGDDFLSVDSTNGLFATSGAISFNGGLGDNKLLLSQGTNAQGVNTIQQVDNYQVFGGPGQGSDLIIDPSGTESQFVKFQNLAPVIDTVPATLLTVGGTDGNNIINYTQSPSSPTTDGLVSVDNFEPITFSNKAALELAGEGGDDTIVVNNPNTPTGLTAISVDGGSGNNTFVENAQGSAVTSANVSSTAVSLPSQLAVGYTNIQQIHIVNSTDALLSVAATLSATEGLSTGSQLVGSFSYSDAVPPIIFGNPSDFTAEINWGDSTGTTAGTIVTNGVNGATAFQVFGSHTYANEGSSPISITVTDKGSSRAFTPTGGTALVTITAAPGANTTINSTATIADAPLSAQGALVQGVEGRGLSNNDGATFGQVLLTTFTDANPGATAADYTTAPGSIVVSWGDGTTTEVLPGSANLTLTSAGSPNGVVFKLAGSHLYLETGSYQITVTITDNGGAQIIAHAEADIADAALAAPAALQPVVNIVESSIFPVPTFGTPLPTFSVGSFSDANPAATVFDFQATINWGDGTPRSTGIVTQPGGAGTAFVILGAHIYADSGVKFGIGHYPITISVVDDGGSQTTISNTANVTDNPIVLNGKLDPKSDSGISNSDAITNVNRPNFFGKSEPFSNVLLSVTPIGGGTAITTSTEAGSDGSWDIVSNLLPDGAYVVTVTAVDQFNQTAGGPVALVPNLVIDTVGPKVTNVYLDRTNRTVDLMFQDEGSGLNFASIQDASNYSLTKHHTQAGAFLVTALPTQGSVGSAPVGVQAVINLGQRLRGGFYTFEIFAASVLKTSGVQDVAGNALDGEFYGYFPSGNNVNGGDFVARLDAVHHFVLPPITTVGTASPVKPPGRIPPITLEHRHVKVTLPLGYPLINPHLRTHPPTFAGAPVVTPNAAAGSRIAVTKHQTATTPFAARTRPFAAVAHKVATPSVHLHSHLSRVR